MSESGKAASPLAVAPVIEGATAHETLILILRELRRIRKDSEQQNIVRFVQGLQKTTGPSCEGAFLHPQKNVPR